MPNPVLQKIYNEGAYVLPGGDRIEVSASGGVSWHLAEALYRTVKQYRPDKAIEIGMASGVSTLSILTAMGENGNEGSLISVDPFQSSYCRNAGRNHVEMSGFSSIHTVMEEMDFVVLPRLLAEGQRFDFVYIDGNHDFEYVVLDYFYANQLLNPNGIVAFNDCGWRSVHAAMRHIPPASSYEEIDVGLKPDYVARNPLFSLLRRLEKRSSSDRYFRKRPTA